MEYLSFSRLSLLETCGLRFYYEYVLQLPPEDEVPTYHASFGKLVHALYEQHGNGSGKDDFTSLKAVYDNQFPVIVPDFPSRAEAVVFYKRGLQAIWRFSRYHVDDVVASEQEFLFEVAAGVPPIKGFIDRVLRVPEHGYVVADLKTGKVFSTRNPKKVRQLVIYSLACQEVYGQAANSGYFDFVVHGGREWVTINDQDRSAAQQWVADKWRQIEQEEYHPRYAAGFCAGYCPFRSRCPEFSKKHSPAAIS